MRARHIILLILLCLGPSLPACGLLTGQVDVPPKPAEEDTQWKPEPLPYAPAVEISGSLPKAEHDDLKQRMEGLAEIFRLKGTPPDGVLGLELRARADADRALRLMHSRGYFDAAVDLALDTERKPARAVLRLAPGARYVIGRTSVSWNPPPMTPENIRNGRRSSTFDGVSALWGSPRRRSLPPPEFPAEVPGLKPGDPPVADDILAAVEKVPARIRERGFPLAKTTSARYLLDRRKRTLDVVLEVAAGPPATLGDLMITGLKDVDEAYLRRLLPWRPGEEPWSTERVDDFADQLRGLGLFRSVEVRRSTDAAALAAGATAEKAAPAPIQMDVRESDAMRSVGAELLYDTSTGFGATGEWEHRNLFGGGERMTVTAPFSTEKQGVIMKLEKPAFGTRHTRLVIAGSGLHEHYDSYDKDAVTGSVGLDHRFTREWSAGAGMEGEAGRLKENAGKAENYHFWGPNLSIGRDTRDWPKSPTSGTRVVLTARPRTGDYRGGFNAHIQEVDISAHWSPLGVRGRGRDRRAPLTLSGRFRADGVFGTSLKHVPPPLRRFAGGSSTVRGYRHQGLGPRDSEGEPLGGLSSNVVNMEARFAVTDDIGIVPFLDGGMAYRDETPPWLSDMRWGAGLGLRYFTPIGPLRVDVATPLNPREDDSRVFLYVSIGQTF